MRVNKVSFTTLLSRWAKLLTGLAFIGFSVAFMKHANLGLGPWDVLSDGLAGLTGMQLGTVSIIVGAIVLLLWIPMREKPGVALIPNILLIGAFTNMGLALVQSACSVFLRSAWLVTGLLLAGFGSALYLGSQLGAGPRDGLMLGLSKKTGWSVRRTRTALEVFVLIVGWILGGSRRYRNGDLRSDNRAGHSIHGRESRATAWKTCSPATSSITAQWLRSLVAFAALRVSGGHLFFSVFTSNNVEAATWRSVTIALLSDLQPNHFGQQCFREPANLGCSATAVASGQLSLQMTSFSFSFSTRAAPPMASRAASAAPIRPSLSRFFLLGQLSTS